MSEGICTWLNSPAPPWLGVVMVVALGIAKVWSVVVEERNRYWRRFRGYDD